MSRFAEIMNRIKKDLNQYNIKNINFNEMKWAINKAQETYIFKYNIIEKEVTINVVAGVNKYPLEYNGEPIIKKVKSVLFPTDWGELQWKTSKQFDQEVSDFPTLDKPAIITIRNKNIELWGKPTDTAEIKYWAFLTKQTVDADDTNELEIDPIFDEAIRYYANYLLMPLEHPLRVQMKQEAEVEAEKNAQIVRNTDSYSRSPIPNW